MRYGDSAAHSRVKANPEKQGLKPGRRLGAGAAGQERVKANPEKQGLKHSDF